MLCIPVIAVVQLNAQDKISVNDGPYVFYENGKTVVKRVKNNQVETLENPKQIKVEFNDHPDWNFSVSLKSKLENEPTDFFKSAEKLLVLSDIEGEFEGFRALLLANKVIDKNYKWIFGKGHLVIDGDLFDRGEQVPEYLWLLYKLEQDAKEQGGYVHTILGNHDIMNLSGDLRYVQPKYMESAKLMELDYMRLYDEHTELGRWLRTKNIVERIDDKLFMHAGMSPEVYALQIGLDEINAKARPYYATVKKDLPGQVKVFFGKDSPFWYRGYFMEPKATFALVERMLRYYECSLIVVGHTIVDKNVAFYYHNKVLAVDVDEHAGQRAGALFLHGKWYKVDDTGKRIRLYFIEGNDDIKKEQIL